MKTTIDGKRYDTSKCDRIGSNSCYNNGNYSGSCSLYRASDGQLLVETISNGQDLYMTDSCMPLEDSSKSIEDFDMTDEQEVLAAKYGLITIVPPVNFKSKKIINFDNTVYYDVFAKTPLSNEGNILFNERKQVLFIDRGYFAVYVVESGFDDFSSNFVWIECDRNQLEVGDVAYRTDLEFTEFNYLPQLCAILNEHKCVFIRNELERMGEVIVDDVKYEHWFKLIPRKLVNEAGIKKGTKHGN